MYTVIKEFDIYDVHNSGHFDNKTQTLLVDRSWKACFEKGEHFNGSSLDRGSIKYLIKNGNIKEV